MNYLKKTYNFLWKSDSVWSWIVSLALALLFIKFIFFPGLSLIFGNPMPLVVIESSSMEHHGSLFGKFFHTQASFDAFIEEEGLWYQDNNIEKEEIRQWPWQTGMYKGDIILVTNRGEIEVGDVIIFNAGQRNPIIHRLIDTQEVNGSKFYSTKGDNNPSQLSSEITISEDQIIGKALLRIPKVGWAKLIFVEIYNKILYG